MGLSKSKEKQKKDEEQKKTPPHSVPKAKGKVSEAKQGDEESLNSPTDTTLGSGSAKHQRSASVEEKPDVKLKPSKKKTAIPQIIITRASTETLMSYDPSDTDEQRTIREHTGWGLYYRHRDPSTIAAYEPGRHK